jgi:transcriptional regulator with XRE-family HTH domain
MSLNVLAADTMSSALIYQHQRLEFCISSSNNNKMKDKVKLHRFRPRIEELRKRSGISLERLAELAGTTYGQIRNLRDGKCSVSFEWLDRLSKALSCYPSELLPVGWQKPDLEKLNEERLEQAVRGAMTHDAFDLKEAGIEITPETMTQLILSRYELKTERERGIMVGKIMAKREGA